MPLRGYVALFLLLGGSLAGLAIPDGPTPSLAAARAATTPPPPGADPSRPVVRIRPPVPQPLAPEEKGLWI